MQRLRGLVLLVLVALVGAFFYKHIFTSLILGRGDTLAYFYPYWHIRDHFLSIGQLPLWSNDLFMGVPLLANSQLGTFYPPNWLTIPFDTPTAIKISILGHITLAALGGAFLARRALSVSWGGAFISGAVFAFSGYLGAHVEQINQLQGLAWMPILFLTLDLALKSPKRYVPLMGVVWGLQLLTGHTQTVFISGVGMGIYALLYPVDKHPYRLKSVLWVGLGAIIGLLIALPQIIPTQELTSLSNRGDGLTRHEATAFSLDPTIIGRGLLPSYAGQPFSEYVGYLGIVGVGLMIAGLMSHHHKRWLWGTIALIGIFFAIGRYNPIYYEILAGLPGFNLFRVPARWLALFALGGAVLAGLGYDTISSVNRKYYIPIFGIFIASLMISALFAQEGPERVLGYASPTALTFGIWFGIFGIFVAGLGYRKRFGIYIPILLVLELWLASHTLPYNDLIDPAVYHSPRFPVSYMIGNQSDELIPSRLLSISRNTFDLGDKDRLEARWQRLNMGATAQSYAFTATKLNEIIAPNLSQIWNIPIIDGFDGGVLPTLYYSTFADLLMPDGALRTIDGRLRENLALDRCRGACLPDQKWLDFTDTGYLLVDKLNEVVHEGVFFDTTFIPNKPVIYPNLQAFVADELHVLYQCSDCDAPIAFVDDQQLTAFESKTPVSAFNFARYRFNPDPPQTITFNESASIVAVTLVDSRTGNYSQLLPAGWMRVHSGDVEIYRNLNTFPRAFVIYGGYYVGDSLWIGSEQALSLMQEDEFIPSNRAIIHNQTNENISQFGDNRSFVPASITEYSDTSMTIQASADAENAYLIVTDAFYPNWHATIDGKSVEILRANIMFRAIPLPVGDHEIRMAYRIDYLPALMVLSWGIIPLGLILSVIIRWRTVFYRGHAVAYH
jgi:hypothetical protein